MGGLAWMGGQRRTSLGDILVRGCDVLWCARRGVEVRHGVVEVGGAGVRGWDVALGHVRGL